MKKKDDVVNRKLKRYRLFGAEYFQKVVFLIEKVKYKVIKKFFPNVIVWYEERCDKRYLKLIKKNHQEENISLLREYQKLKLAFRKEMVYEKNRNYHYDPNYPTKFIEYLETNKKIHISGLKKNIVALIGIGVFSLFFGPVFPTVGILMVIYEMIGLIINFECINLQNYNLCRFQNHKMQMLLEKVEEKRSNENLRQLAEGMKPVVKAMNKQVEIPTTDQVVDNINTREETTQLLGYLKEQLIYLQNNNKTDNNDKKIGGIKNV